MVEITRERAHVLDLAGRVVRTFREGRVQGAEPEAADLLERGVREQEADPSTDVYADEQAFIPRDPAIAVVQASMDERNRRRRRRIAPESRTARFLRWLLPSRFYYPFAEGFNPLRRFDPGWAKTVLESVFTYRRQRRSFPRPGRPRPTELATNARLILVSDWGTGTEFAQDVAARMGEWIEGARGRQVHVVHLGDVYYAGTRWEAENRFLWYWPVAEEDGDLVGSWCLNGNHDMYAAGTGLFETILGGDPRFARQRALDGSVTSEFHLRNSSWQVMGLDTAWEFDGDDPAGRHGRLDETQVAWLDECVATGDSPRTILLSHHPAFTNGASGVEPGSGLLPATSGIRSRHGGIDAWFWGHQHRLIKYTTDPAIGIRYAVCTGHGAVPERPTPADEPVPVNEERFEGRVVTDGVEWYECGFTVLDFADEDVAVTYVGARGSSWGESPEWLPGPP